MNKLQLLLAQLETKKVEIREFLDVKDVTKAEAAVTEKRALESLIKMEQEIETEEKRSLETQKKTKLAVETKDVSEMRSIVKSIMRKEMTTEERATIVSSDNAAVMPKQFINQLQELKIGYGSIKNYCDVIQVMKNEGTIPVVDLMQNELPVVVEGDNIVDGALVTTDLPFICAKHGLIQSLSSETVDDAEVEIEGLCKKNFVEIVTIAENTKILNIIKTNAVAVTSTGYEDLEKAIDKSIPAVKAGLATYTNVDGYAELKNKKDLEGRSLNLVTEVGGKYYFNAKELVVVDSALLPTGATMAATFYIVNMKEAVKFCDRKAVTVARSTEAGFRDDTIKLRILERFGVVKGSVRSIKKIEY
jgi:HK97 family phage major capsid protein